MKNVLFLLKPGSYDLEIYIFGPALKRSKKGMYCQGDLSIWLLQTSGGYEIKIFGPPLERPKK